MVTPEERVTRIEAVQEANTQRFGDVNARLDMLFQSNESLRRDMVQAIDAARQEAREANEAARQEAREANEAARQEAREANKAARQEAREANISLGQEIENLRKENRAFFFALLSLGGGFLIGLITFGMTILNRLPD